MPSQPHGGHLVDRVLRGQRRAEALETVRTLPRIDVEGEAASDVINICTGAYSPLDGFLSQKDYAAVLKDGRLASGLPWTIPIVLDVAADVAAGLKESAGLWHRGVPLAVLRVEAKYAHDRAARARAVFGTEDVKHPGVARVLASEAVLVGGAVEMLLDPSDAYRLLSAGREEAGGSVVERYALTPAETRVLFEEKGWTTIVGFQTRNVPHLGHEYLQKTALTFVDGLLINPVIGRKQTGDFKDDVILKSYEALLEHYYPAKRAVMVALHTEMRYAGPREAIYHAIVRKNLGCTHFIVGRDHAGVGNFYDPFAAHAIFDQYPDLGIQPLFFSSFFYCRHCGAVANDKTCPHGDDERIAFSGTLLRNLLSGGEVPDGFIRPEVAAVLQGFERPLIEAP